MARSRNSKLQRVAEIPGQKSLQGWLRQSTQAVETAAEKRGPVDLSRGICADHSPMAKVARLSEEDGRRPSACGSKSVDDCIADVKILRHEETSPAQNSPQSKSSLHGDAEGPGRPQSPLGQPKSTLRQRLAQRVACGSPEPASEMQHPVFSSPLRRQQDEQREEQQQHRPLGGLSLQWRLTLLGGAQTAANRKATLQREDQARNSAIGATEAPPLHTKTLADTVESMRTSAASLGPVDMMSEDISTPPRSGRSSTVTSPGTSTPVPPPQDARSYVTPRSEAVEGAVPPKKRTMQKPSSPAGHEANAPKSVKELKTLLEKQGINCETCTCREDLEDLWRLHVEISGRQTEQEGQHFFASSTSGREESVSVQCKRSATLLESSPCSEKLETTPLKHATPPGRDTADGMNLSARKQVAEEEISRLLGLHEDTFASRARWAFSVLRLPLSGAGTTIAAVQHAYRGLMRTVHPDRVGPLNGLSQAIEMLRRARAESERALEREVVPGQPRSLRAHVLCADSGLHRVKLEWEAPATQREAPVRSYVIAAVDPSFGKALTVAKLEPDYNEELNRFVSIEELVSFLLAETEMPKMSGLFRQQFATLQVAAANKAGQSSWSVVKVALRRPVKMQEAIG